MNRPKAFLQWAVDIFGHIALNRDERAIRFVEEAIELGHAAGLSRDVIARVLDRVYDRPPGDVAREIGQAAATLEMFAESIGLSVEIEAIREFVRVHEIPKDEWTRRHAAKVAIGVADLSPVSEVIDSSESQPGLSSPESKTAEATNA